MPYSQMGSMGHQRSLQGGQVEGHIPCAVLRGGGLKRGLDYDKMKDVILIATDVNPKHSPTSFRMCRLFITLGITLYYSL